MQKRVVKKSGLMSIQKQNDTRCRCKRKTSAEANTTIMGTLCFLLFIQHLCGFVHSQKYYAVSNGNLPTLTRNALFEEVTYDTGFASQLLQDFIKIKLSQYQTAATLERYYQIKWIGHSNYYLILWECRDRFSHEKSKHWLLAKYYSASNLTDVFDQGTYYDEAVVVPHGRTILIPHDVDRTITLQKMNNYYRLEASNAKNVTAALKIQCDDKDRKTDEQSNQSNDYLSR